MKIDQFRTLLTKSFSEGLPGEQAHKKALPINRPLSSEVKIQAKNTYRASAVSILIHPSKTNIESALIQRPAYNGVHGGQISFPGGKMEVFDQSLMDTARRECFEEIGFPKHRGELVGSLTEVYIPVSKFLVQPFVFFEYEEPTFVPDPREVSEIIKFDLIEFAQKEIDYTTIKAQNGVNLKNIPYYNIKGRIVWGATAIILAELQEILKRFC